MCTIHSIRGIGNQKQQWAKAKQMCIQWNYRNEIYKIDNRLWPSVHAILAPCDQVEEWVIDFDTALLPTIQFRIRRISNWRRWHYEWASTSNIAFYHFFLLDSSKWSLKPDFMPISVFTLSWHLEEK